jgi:hypothetical protein
VTHFGRGLLFGIGAALAGSILWALVSAVTGMQFALLSIVIGIMVGKAVTYGARGCRGRRYQIAAVLLTYGAITTSYIPQYISEIAGMRTRKAKAAAKSDSGHLPAPSATQNPTTPAKPISVLSYFIFAVLLVALSLIAPFIGVSAGFSGILNLVIIFIGLSRAWLYTKPDNAPILGPYPASGLGASMI